MRKKQIKLVVAIDNNNGMKFWYCYPYQGLKVGHAQIYEMEAEKIKPANSEKVGNKLCLTLKGGLK